MTLRDTRSQPEQISDVLRWLIVGGTLAVLLLILDIVTNWGSGRSFVELLLAIALGALVVTTGLRVYRSRG